MTKLHLAVEEGDVQKVIGLLAGENVNSKNDYGLTPLIVAAREGHARVAKVLIESGAQLDYAGRRGKTALHIAAEKGHAETVETLLDFGVGVDGCDRYNRTPLMWACIEGKSLVVALLLKSGANLNSRDRVHLSPLHLACAQGKENIVKLLLEHGADINITDRNHNTPLHLAVEKGHEQIVLLLTRYGADVSDANRLGMTPLHLSTKLSDHLVTIAEILLKCGAEVNARNRRGQTPLHMASRHNFFLLIPMLIYYGADALIKCHRGFYAVVLENVTGRMHSSLDRSFIEMATAGFIPLEMRDCCKTLFPGFCCEENRQAFCDECHTEILHTISDTIADTNYSYYRILMGKMAVRNKIVEKTLTQSHCEQKFPIYGWMIHYRYRMISFKANLLEYCINRLSTESDFISLPPECVEKICRYLTYQQVKMLARSFNFDPSLSCNDEVRWPAFPPDLALVSKLV